MHSVKYLAKYVFGCMSTIIMTINIITIILLIVTKIVNTYIG